MEQGNPAPFSREGSDESLRTVARQDLTGEGAALVSGRLPPEARGATGRPVPELPTAAGDPVTPSGHRRTAAGRRRLAGRAGAGCPVCGSVGRNGAEASAPLQAAPPPLPAGAGGRNRSLDG